MSAAFVYEEVVTLCAWVLSLEPILYQCLVVYVLYDKDLYPCIHRY